MGKILQVSIRLVKKSKFAFDFEGKTDRDKKLNFTANLLNYSTDALMPEEVFH